MSYWSEVVQETTTFTLPNPDEYERPEEIREIEVNRVKARSMAVEGDALSFSDKLRASLLGQLNEAMSDWEDRDLRRSFVHMQVCKMIHIICFVFLLRSLSVSPRVLVVFLLCAVSYYTCMPCCWAWGSQGLPLNGG